MVGQCGHNTMLWCALWTLWSVLHFSAVRCTAWLCCAMSVSVRSSEQLCCVICWSAMLSGRLCCALVCLAVLCCALEWERNEWKANPKEKIYEGVLCHCNYVVLQLCCAARCVHAAGRWACSAVCCCTTGMLLCSGVLCGVCGTSLLCTMLHGCAVPCCAMCARVLFSSVRSCAV